MDTTFASRWLANDGSEGGLMAVAEARSLGQDDL